MAKRIIEIEREYRQYTKMSPEFVHLTGESLKQQIGGLENKVEKVSAKIENLSAEIEELKKRGSIPGLDAIQGLLEELGHPEDDLKIVHIAGTNGKGSVFAYLSSILMASGFNVVIYI